MVKYAERESLLAAAKSLIGTRSSTRADFAMKLNGLGKLPAAVEKAVWEAFSVSDPDGEVQTDRKGRPLPDADLRDNENVPLDEDIREYFKREVFPDVPHAWIDEGKTRIGYEIPFTRHFHVYGRVRPIHEIDDEIKRLSIAISAILSEVVA
ncbi:hypothetical protein [Micromonospora sp. NPDC126480]|uniref:hypothetical protein n=1 Tax=Micromonospora sp. NPDC126480 TaxID=3155312 RepID=UPI00332E6D82